VDVHGAGDLQLTAYTAGGLPYQTGGDRPCDAPATWCDFTTALEAQLYADDLVIGRYDPTIPMAKMSRSTLITATIGATAQPVAVPFEGSDVDTDDMIDFSISSFNIRPRRLGTYLVTGTLMLYVTGFDNLSLYITRGPIVAGTFGTGFTAIAESGIVMPASSSTAVYGIKVSAHSAWSSDDTLGFGLLLNPTAAGTINIVSATLAAYWVNDLEIFG
jgi:hypothetical protein